MFNVAHDNRKPLSSLELQILNAVWAKGKATAEDVRASLSDEKPMKESTVRTLLRRLEGKGYVSHITKGRTYVYQGVEQPKQLAASAVGQIIDRFCGGSVEQLLTGMIDAEVVDASELEQLVRKIKKNQKRS